MQLTIEITDESQISNFMEILRNLSYISVPAKATTRKRKVPKATLDFELLDEATKVAVHESLAAYRAGDMEYFQWKPEHEDLKQDLLAAGVQLCGV
ncbi:MAG: hypothetical protein RLZZ292_511 [Bacteroidota bacterium]|jgi:hypothetical protein